MTHFLGATVCKTVRPIPSDHCLSLLSVCDVGVLWPNGWMDQDATWYQGRPRPMPHCVRSGPSSPLPNGHSPTNFWPISVVAKQLNGSRCHCMEAGLGLGNIVIDGDLQKETQQPPHFSPRLLWPNGSPSQQLLSSC